MRRPRRMMAVDPTFRGFAYVILEGGDLVDWGLSQVTPLAPGPVARRVLRLLKRWEPELLVLEEPEGSRRGRRARRIIGELAELADRQNLAWCMVTRRQVNEAFQDPPNKHQVALAVAERFPELRHRLPRPRKPWMSEDERMALFDAASFALTVLRRSGRDAA